MIINKTQIGRNGIVEEIPQIIPMKTSAKKALLKYPLSRSHSHQLAFPLKLGSHLINIEAGRPTVCAALPFFRNVTSDSKSD